MAYDNIHLEKGMYHQSGRTFLQILEQLDPSENYRGTVLENTDAFERQLMRFGVKTEGADSDRVDAFFASGNSAVLFPEFVAREVRKGMEEVNLLSEIVASVTNIDSMDYRSVRVDSKESERELADVAEGSTIPQFTSIKARENLVTLKKHGRMLVASYETLRFKKLDLFSLVLRQIGAQIQKMRLADAVNVILKGDGNGNGAEIFDVGNEISGTAGELEYAQLVEFWSKFAPYEMNTLLVNADGLTRILTLPELKNPFVGTDVNGAAKLCTPLGTRLLHCSAVEDDCIIGLDKRYALELVQVGDVNVECDKLIDRQLERAAITTISGFAKICDDASKVLYIE